VATSTGVLSYLKAPIVFVTGKGGVGKTTVGAALALAAARSGQRAALVEFDDDAAGQRALRGADAPVSHVVATYEKAIEAAIAPLVGGALIARAALRQSAVKRMTKAMPAMREFVSLERVRVLASSGDFDRVVVDLPASGHALDWLRVPQAFDRFLRGGPLGLLGRRVHEEVVAAGRSDVVIVTLAEPMVMRETEQLASRFHAELGRRASMVVVNRVPRSDPPGSEQASARLADASNDPSAREFAALLRARAEVAREAFEALRLSGNLDAAKVVALPDNPSDPPVGHVAHWLDQGAARS
jgi:anion-transporting  ArsA/GET3 family ATPase